MNATWIDLDPSTKAAVHNAIISKSSILTQQGLSNCIWALQAMGYSIYDESGIDVAAVGLRNSFSTAIVRLSPSITAQGVATTLYSMGKMGCRFSTLPIQTRISLESVCVRERSSMGAKEVSMALYGLAKMDTSLNIFSKNTQGHFISAVTKSCRSMDEQELGNTVWALCRLGYGLKGESGRALFDAIVRKQEQLKRQSLLAIFQGLASQASIAADNSFEYSDDFLPVPNRVAIWVDLPPTLKDALLTSLDRLLEVPAEETAADGTGGNSSISISFDPQLAGTVLYQLGRLRAWHADLPDFILSKLLSHMSAPATDPMSQEAAVVLSNQTGERTHGRGFRSPVVLGVNGIASMGVKWDLMDPKDRDVLYSTILKTLNEHLQALSQMPTQGNEEGTGRPMSPAGISSFLWSLGRMGLKFKSLLPIASPILSESELESESTDKEMAGNKMSATVPVGATSYPESSVMKRLESALERDLLLAVERVVPAMTPYELAWSLWALAKTGVTFTDLIASKRPLGMLLLLAVNRHISAMGERELGIVLWVSEVKSVSLLLIANLKLTSTTHVMSTEEIKSL